MSTATCMTCMTHGTWHVCDERITKYMLFNTIANILEIFTNMFSIISVHPHNYFYRYGMSLKQILHDKILIIEINATDWVIGLIFFVNIWNDITDIGFINLIHIFSTFSQWLWRLHLTCSPLVCGSLDISFLLRTIGIFSSEPWIRIGSDSHRYPWFPRYNISICTSCWVLASIKLVTFYCIILPRIWRRVQISCQVWT